MGELFFESITSLIGFWPAVAIFVTIGVAGLKYGADWLIDGAINLGLRYGMSGIMIGLTLVAFGTSAPELVVSIMTAVKDQPEISLGNAIGSNIANTTLILGVTAIIFPLKIQPVSIRFDGPVNFLAVLLVLALALFGFGISRIDGFLLLAAFTVWMLWLGRKTMAGEEVGAITTEEYLLKKRSLSADIGWMALGLIGLAGGAELLVAGAVATAHRLEVPEVVVGLTVVAVGTSLPELAVCVLAAFRKQAEITVGNILGSNTFNALLIIGTVTVLAPITFQIKGGFAWNGDAGTLFVDIPLCVVICGLIVPMMGHRRELGRVKGFILVGIYIAYIVSLIIRNG